MIELEHGKVKRDEASGSYGFRHLSDRDNGEA